MPIESFELFAKPDGRFAIPDWHRVEESLAALVEKEDAHTLWTNVGLCWMHALKGPLGEAFRVSGSDNFFLLSSDSARVN